MDESIHILVDSSSETYKRIMLVIYEPSTELMNVDSCDFVMEGCRCVDCVFIVEIQWCAVSMLQLQ